MKRENKITIASILGLTTLSCGLWGYQNYVLPQQEAQHQKIMYVASRDIPTNATIEADMLEPIEVPEKAVIPGVITSVDSVVGTRLTGGVLKGEALFEQRLSTDIKEEGEFFVRAEPDYAVDLEDGENVRVLVQHGSKITQLFSRKQVYATKRIMNLLDGEPTTGFYLLLTEQELENYYHAKSEGAIILTKIDTVATDEDIANSTGEPIVIHSDDSKVQNENNSNNRYTVQEGQSLEDIAYELETTEDVLKELNDGKKEVKKGDIIIIP